VVRILGQNGPSVSITDFQGPRTTVPRRTIGKARTWMAQIMRGGDASFDATARREVNKS
jgi:hypothetical protein